MYIHEATKSLAFHADDPFAIREVIRHSKTLDHADYNVAVKHTIENVRVLRNLGFNDAPLPPYHWPGKYRPLPHQKVMAEFQVIHPRCFNLSEPGTMKTAATLWAADMLMKEGLVTKAAIFTTLSTVDNVWMQGIFETLMHRRGVIAHGTREQRAKAMARDVDFYVVNHDGLMIPQVYDPVHKRKDINLIIVDEGSVFRNAGTDMYKALVSMIRPDQRIWWLTGGPCPNEPTDAWAQARIINPHNVPKFKGAFQREVMVKVSEFKWVSRPGAQEMAYKAMQPGIRFLKKDCVNLPPMVTVKYATKISKEQRQHLEEMKGELTTVINGRQITAVNAADKINKMRQILCGAIKDATNDDYVAIPHKERLQTLVETIQQAAGKVVIIVPFKGIIKILERELREKHFTVGVLNGDVTQNNRNKIISDFKTLPDPKLLLCHPKVMAHGLNLTEADMTIFYAPIYSNDEYGQVIERINRMPQTRKMTVARIGAHPLEWAIYRMLDEAAATQESILSLYRQVVDGSLPEMAMAA